MDGVASAAMKSDKLAPWFYDGADEKGRHRRTAFWRGKSVTVAFFSDKVRWWECEGASDGPGEPSYALWGHGGRPRRPPDGPDGLGRATRKFPVREGELNVQT